MGQKVKKVAWFFPSMGKLGGAERRLARIMSGMNQESIQSFIVLHILNDTEFNIIEEKYRSFCSENIEIKCFKKTGQIVKYIKEMRFDWVCYTDCYIRALPAILGALCTKSKRLMLNVTTFSSSFKETSVIKKLTYSLIAMQSTHLDCLYPTSAQILRAKFNSKRITLTPGSFTNLNIFKPSSEKENTIVFAGRLINIKHPELLANAVVTCQDIMREKKYRCVFCGDGDLKEEVLGILRNGNCEDLCSILGNINTEDIMPYTKIFCSLQEYNNYPSQSLLEAIACGCYCIATDEGDTNLIVKESFGKLVKFSIKQLSDALIEAMYFSEENFINIQDNARNFASQNFNIETSIYHYENIFNHK